MTIQTSHRAGTTFCRSLIVQMPGFALPPTGNFALQFRTAPAATPKLSFTTERGSIHIESYNSTEGVVRLVLLAGPRETQRLDGLYRGNLVYQDGPEVTTIGDDIDLRITAEGTSIVLPETPSFNDLALWPDPIDLAGGSQTTIMAVIERGLPGPQGIPGNMTTAAQQQIADALAAAQTALGASADVTTKAGQVSAALISINQTAGIITGQQADVTAKAATATGAAATATAKAADAAASVVTAAGHVTTASGHATAAGASATTSTTKATEAATSAAAAQAALAAMPANRATVAEADAAVLNTRWVGPDGLVNRPLRKSASVVINVPVGGDIQAAINALNAYLFEGTATGDVVLAAGVHTIAASLYCRHPQGPFGRIRLLGPAVPVLPADGDWSGIKATDQAMLRTKFGATVVCATTYCIGMTASYATGLYVDGISFEKSGAEASYGIYLTGPHTLIIGTAIAVSGYLQGVRSRAGARIMSSDAGTIIVAHNGNNIAKYSGSRLEVAVQTMFQTGTSNMLLDKDCVWSSTGTSKIRGGAPAINANRSRIMAEIESIRDYSGHAIFASDQSDICILNNGLVLESGLAPSYAAYASRQSRIRLGAIALNDANAAGARTFYAVDGSSIHLGTVTGTAICSPALQTLGNDNSYISA